MRKIGLLIALLSVCLISIAGAHTAPAYSDSTSLEDDDINVTHWETDDYTETGNLIPDSEMKGTFTATLTNTGDDPWGDFHFAITQYTDVYFTTNGGLYPTMNGAVMADEDFLISTEGGYSTIDLFFYDDSVVTNEEVTFVVYTDNTAGNHSFFGICMYPTPVPEPATLAMLGFGALVLLRRKK
ncbi:MAG: PEP-CTERM sorting domain-containing protein [Planctomycetota bacterium]|jgi:hypothetical protein